MPRGDGTGPMGYGRMTGRGAGYCGGFATPGYANPAGFGYGFRRGRGRGRGFRRMHYGVAYPEYPDLVHHAYGDPVADFYDEREVLSRQAKVLEQQLQQVKKRLSNLEEYEADEDEANEANQAEE